MISNADSSRMYCIGYLMVVKILLSGRIKKKKDMLNICGFCKGDKNIIAEQAVSFGGHLKTSSMFSSQPPLTHKK